MPLFQFCIHFSIFQMNELLICQFLSTSVSYFFHTTHIHSQCRLFSQFYNFFVTSSLSSLLKPSNWWTSYWNIFRQTDEHQNFLTFFHAFAIFRAELYELHCFEEFVPLDLPFIPKLPKHAAKVVGKKMVLKMTYIPVYIGWKGEVEFVWIITDFTFGVWSLKWEAYPDILSCTNIYMYTLFEKVRNENVPVYVLQSHWGGQGISPLFLTSSLNTRWSKASRTNRFDFG